MRHLRVVKYYIITVYRFVFQNIVQKHIFLARLRPKAWKAEIATLTVQNDSLYREVRKLKEDVAEAETVKRCVNQVIPLTEQRKEKSKTQDISL